MRAIHTRYRAPFRGTVAAGLLAAALIFVSGDATAQTADPGELGVRAGGGLGGASGARYFGLHWRPWQRSLMETASGWTVLAYGGVQLARVSYQGDRLYKLSAGPGLWIGHRDLPLALGLGTAPTLISGRRLGSRALGGPFQFTSHLALRWQASPGFSLTYRLQHTSNAGLHSDNDGFDIQMLEAAYAY